MGSQSILRILGELFSKTWLQEVKIGDQLQESGPNAFVGGKSRWK